eukprot:4761494-Prymnesium_polylepis.1
MGRGLGASNGESPALQAQSGHAEGVRPPHRKHEWQGSSQPMELTRILASLRVRSRPAVKQSGNPAIRQSGNQAIRQSGNQAIRQRSPGCWRRSGCAAGRRRRPRG